MLNKYARGFFTRLFTPLARLLPGRRTPGVAILVTTALAIVLAVTGELVERSRRCTGSSAPERTWVFPPRG